MISPRNPLGRRSHRWHSVWCFPGRATIVFALFTGFVAFARAESDQPNRDRIPAAIVLGGMTQPYTGLPRVVTVSTSPADLKVRVTYNGVATAPVLPGRYRVSATIDDPRYAGTVTELMTVSVTALVRHAPDNQGAIDGSVQVTSAEDMLLDGRSSLSGDLLVPGTPALDLGGLPMVVGTVDANGVVAEPRYSIFVRDWAVVRYIVRCVDPLPIPKLERAPAAHGTKDLAITERGTGDVDWDAVRDIGVVADTGIVAIPPGAYGRLTVAGAAPVVLGDPNAAAPAMYRFEALSVRSGARIRLAGPVVLMVAEGIDVDGGLGDVAHARWLTVAIERGGLRLRAGARVAGLVLAPQGEIEIGRGARLTGEVIGDRLLIDPDGALIEPSS